MDTSRSLLLGDIPATKLQMEDIWEEENASGPTCGLLSAVTPQQKASFVAHCELSRICTSSMVDLLDLNHHSLYLVRQCLSIVRDEPQHDLQQAMHLLDEGRKSLASKMHVETSTRTDTYYLNIQAMSYRFECVLCREIRRQPQNMDRIGYAKQRVRSAMLELDTIAMRVLALGTLWEFPVIL